jgi:ribosomal protein L11 methyltransferase PrmA
MSDLNSDTVLQVAPSLKIELGARTIIHIAGREMIAPTKLLAILDAFSHPVTYSSAVKELSTRVSGAQAWIELVSSIRALHLAGVLVDESGAAPAPTIGYSAPHVHVAMLNDRARTAAFLAAIAAVVKPGDVVVDIGTGTGVLAVAAAKAGARHVYAVEASEMGRTAKEMFAANGFSDRITLLPGWSTHIDLPEKANVLVSEMIGNDPVEEGVLEIFDDARRRFLTTEARIIPSRVRALGAPLEIDEKTLATHSFSADDTRNWSESYGLNFDSLLDAPANKSIQIAMRPQEIRAWPQLADPVLLADVDLSGMRQPIINETAEFSITHDGLMGGFLLYFELEVGPGQEISTAPERVEETNHWGVRIRLFAPPRRVKIGEKFKVTYSYRVKSSGSDIEVYPA